MFQDTTNRADGNRNILTLREPGSTFVLLNQEKVFGFSLCRCFQEALNRSNGRMWPDILLYGSGFKGIKTPAACVLSTHLTPGMSNDQGTSRAATST